jgi:hypothetical protein
MLAQCSSTTEKLPGLNEHESMRASFLRMALLGPQVKFDKCCVENKLFCITCALISWLIFQLAAL